MRSKSHSEAAGRRRSATGCLPAAPRPPTSSPDRPSDGEILVTEFLVIEHHLSGAVEHHLAHVAAARAVRQVSRRDSVLLHDAGGESERLHFLDALTSLPPVDLKSVV